MPVAPHAGGERQREFLARFTDSQGIAFAVLGGAFAEGIDLPGSASSVRFGHAGPATVGPVNEQIRERMQALFGAEATTYLYPGLQGGAGCEPRDPHAQRRGRGCI